jgi:hypothetical protein
MWFTRYGTVHAPEKDAGGEERWGLTQSCIAGIHALFIRVHTAVST